MNSAPDFGAWVRAELSARFAARIGSLLERLETPDTA